MKSISPVMRGRPLPADTVNDLIANQKELYELVKQLLLAKRPTRPVVLGAQSFKGGTLLELATTPGVQDIDTWDRDTDDCPVSISVPSGRVEYDTTTHKLYQRFRTWQFDRGGNLVSISAEEDLVEITEAVPGVAAE